MTVIAFEVTDTMLGLVRWTRLSSGYLAMGPTTRRRGGCLSVGAVERGSRLANVPTSFVQLALPPKGFP